MILLSKILNMPGFEMISFLSVGLFIWSRVFDRVKKIELQAKAQFQKAIDNKMHEPFTLHPEINPDLCGGCGGCTRACHEGDIIQLIQNKAVLVAPTKCVGHGECEVACPFGAITLVFGTKTRGMDIPRVTTNYETNIPGLYIAGELGGMGLIRNAIKQGSLAAQHAFKNLPLSKTDYDLIIVGAGPAGIAAGLTAIKEKKSYILIDQNSFGGTVNHYPRQKVVMSQAADLPMIGKMKFKSNKVSKEELLKYWNEVKSKTGLQILENTKFHGLMPLGNYFEVKTSKGLITAKKVILSMGVRGTPRKLNLPNEDLPKVTYNLIDPEQYFQKNIVIVGGGNAGVEAAISLAKIPLKNKIHLVIRESRFDRCNEENQNQIFTLEKQGVLKILFNSTVQEIQSDNVVLNTDNQNIKLLNDFIFIFAGAEVPFHFLMSLGVQIDKKFGESLIKVN